MSKQRPIRYRVGDIVAIPIDDQLVAYARILHDGCLSVFSRIDTTIRHDVNWPTEPSAFYTFFTDKAVRSGEWPIIGHVVSQNPDEDRAPPMCVRDVLPPHHVRFVLDRSGPRAPTKAEAQGSIPEFRMNNPIGVVADIEQRILGRESRALAQFRESLRRGMQESTPEWASFSNDDAFEVLEALDRARGWSALQRRLSRAVKVKGYLESPESKAAVAAAEVVAAGSGQPPVDLPEVVPAFLERVGPPDAELLELARAAVARILRDSELRDLWEESKHFSDWQSAMNDLLERLSRCRS